MKTQLTRRTLAVSIILVLCSTTLLPPSLGRTAAQPKSITTTAQFSPPTTTLENGRLLITVPQATGITSGFGKPQLPENILTYELPRGTHITAVTFTPGPTKTLQASALVQPVPTPTKVGDELLPQTDLMDQTIYGSTDPYPTTWGWYTVGAGLNRTNTRVLHLTLHCTPIHYLPAANTIQYTTTITVSVQYETTPVKPAPAIAYDLVIITPAEYQKPSDRSLNTRTHTAYQPK